MIDQKHIIIIFYSQTHIICNIVSRFKKS